MATDGMTRNWTGKKFGYKGGWGRKVWVEIKMKLKRPFLPLYKIKKLMTKNNKVHMVCVCMC